MHNNFQRTLRQAVGVAACLWIWAANAQNLVEGPSSRVTQQEIQQDLGALNEQARSQLAKAETLKNTVSNIYVRRVLSQDALKAGLDKNPLVINAIERARERILSDAMLEKIDQGNQPTLQDIEAWARSNYIANPRRFETPEQIEASHILIRTGEVDARAKMEDIRKQILAGASFDELAKTRSQDPGSAAKGGSLGSFGRGRMIKPFEDMVFGMTKPGEISPVFESPFGFHVIRLDRRIPAGVKMFAEVKDQLMQEAQSDIIGQGRIKEQARILEGARFNDEAIESLARSLEKPAAR
jgi:peptidyl-prolyl cis-trans isomerase C